MEIYLNNAQIRVMDTPNGGKQIQCLTPNGILVVIPLDAPAAKVIASALSSGILVANGPLTPPPSVG